MSLLCYLSHEANEFYLSHQHTKSYVCPMLLVPCSESFLSHQHTQSYVSVLCYLSHVVILPVPPTHSILCVCPMLLVQCSESYLSHQHTQSLCVCPMLLVPCSESYLSHQHTQSYVSVLCYLSQVVNPICQTNTLNPMCPSVKQRI